MPANPNSTATDSVSVSPGLSGSPGLEFSANQGAGDAETQVGDRTSPTTPIDQKSAKQQQAEILRIYAEGLMKQADQLEKGETGSGAPNGNRTEKGSKRPTSRLPSLPLESGSGKGALGADSF